MSDPTTPLTNNKNKLSIALDYRLLVVVLLAVIITMVALWRPWTQKSSLPNDRTVAVSGAATVKAEPDEYVFAPNYEFKNADKDAALKALTQKSDELVSKIKGLGIPDSNIKTGSNGYNYYPYYYDAGSRTSTYILQLTITANSREQAQKIQDYLITTEPTGAISPQVTFSENKRKELESQARDKATKEARAKADQSAKNLGFKVGAVKSVEDGTGFGTIMPYNKAGVSSLAIDSTPAPELSVQPGQNDLNYTVNVVYFLK